MEVKFKPRLQVPIAVGGESGVAICTVAQETA